MAADRSRRDHGCVVLGDASVLSRLDRGTPEQLDGYVAGLLSHLGYRVTGGAGTGTILVRRGSISAVVHVLSGSRPVDADVIEAAAGHGRTMIVSTSSFTPAAQRAARQAGVVLWDRDRLAREIASFCSVCETRLPERLRDWTLRRGGRSYCAAHGRRLRTLLRPV